MHTVNQTLFQKIYAQILRDRLKKRMPEHSVRIDSLPDDRLIEMDQEHSRLRAEAIRVKFERMRQALR